MSNLKNRVFITALLAVFLSCAFVSNAQTPVAKYGQLQIKNGKVSDKNGNPVVLRGMSLFWSGYPEGSPFFNATTVQWLRDDWCVDVIRAPMSVETGSSTYINNAAQEMAKITAVIDACIAAGLYVVVDFHSHYADQYKAQAKTFFTQIATKYGNTPNVLYEPFNEPITQPWSSVIKPYHTDLISTIRAIDPDNIIICGTKTYSQDVDEAAADPLTGTNIAYTLHYYANSHTGWLRQKSDNALSRGVAIFVTEYGTCDASGNTGFNPTESQVWWNYLEANNLSSCNWAVDNKNETSAILVSGTNALSGWTSSQISQSGALVKNYIKGKCNSNLVTGSITITFGTNNQTQYNVGDAITINATTTVSSGTLGRVDFYDGTTLIGTDNTSPYSLTITTLAGGGHNITAKSYDGTGNLVATSLLYTISVVGNSRVSTTGITDQFESATQFAVLTGGVNGTNCSTATSAAAAGIFWYEDKDTTTPFMAYATRTGNGKLTYRLSQAQGAYNVVGFNFGLYCNGTTLSKYTLDLSKNAFLKLTVSAPTTNVTTLDLKFQMKDINGTVLAINKNILRTDGTIDLNPKTSTWYEYEIGFSKNHVAPDYVSVTPGSTTNFSFDFRNALSINNPNNPNFPTDINTSNANFDFTKVVEVVIIPVNSVDNGANGTPVAWAPLAFTNQKLSFSGLSMGDPSLGPDICTTPNAPTTVPVSYCQNAAPSSVNATGTAGLILKWYSDAVTGTGTTIAPIPSTSVAETISYYVSQAISATSICEGPRTRLDVTVVGAPTANAGTDQSTAVGPTVTLIGTGSDIGKWALVSGQTGATVILTPIGNAASVTASGMTIKGLYKFTYTVAGTSPCASITDTVNVNVTTITSVRDEYLNNNIEIYPNPVTDNLNINLQKLDGNKNLKLVDMFGKVVYESSNVESATIPMENLSTGLYVIQVQTATGILNKTIVKK